MTTDHWNEKFPPGSSILLGNPHDKEVAVTRSRIWEADGSLFVLVQGRREGIKIKVDSRDRLQVSI